MKKPRKWCWQSILSAFLAAIAGIGIGMAAFSAGVKDIPGIWRDIILWSIISIPMGIVMAFVSKIFLKSQVKGFRDEQINDPVQYEVRGMKII